MSSDVENENPRDAEEADVTDLETDLILEAIFQRYGYDFRDYARASLVRRIKSRMISESLETISELQSLILHDERALERLLGDLSIHVTAMFRDPGFFLKLRENVIPILRTYPSIRIWDAGCATGEETYSLAILLEEENLYDRCQIYATDMNLRVIEKAKNGIFPLSAMRENTQNYLAAGGTGSFSDYYTARYENSIFRPDLIRNITFAQHNLVTDQAFNQFHLIICRNVMIYFNRNLQQRVFGLFHDSLERFGILGIGRKETIRFDPLADSFEILDDDEKIYRKIA